MGLWSSTHKKISITHKIALKKIGEKKIVSAHKLTYVKFANDKNRFNT